jgi:CRISPR-associated protein Cas1
VVFGNIQVTTQAAATLLDAGVEVSFLSRQGRFRGRLAPADSKNVPLRLAQFRRYEDPDFRLGLARRIVEAKIRNGRALLLRYGRNHPDADLSAAVGQLDTALPSLTYQSTIPALMGTEGQAAATYFRAYGQMFRRELQFTTRSRRPPRDPINALLSLGYTLLTSEAAGILAAHGLDIHIGYFHEVEYGRPSLSLDLVEEFRQPGIDRFTLSLANKLVLTATDFEDRGEGGVFLQPEPRKRYFAFYERMVTTPFKEHGSGEEVTFRTLLQRQARRLVKCILEGTEYQPFRLP